MTSYSIEDVEGKYNFTTSIKGDFFYTGAFLFTIVVTVLYIFSESISGLNSNAVLQIKLLKYKIKFTKEVLLEVIFLFLSEISDEIVFS